MLLIRFFSVYLYLSHTSANTKLQTSVFRLQIAFREGGSSLHPFVIRLPCISCQKIEFNLIIKSFIDSIFQVLCCYREFKIKKCLYLHKTTIALERPLPLKLLVHKSTLLESHLGPHLRPAHLKMCDQVVTHLGSFFS